jgi:hypothetical protein
MSIIQVIACFLHYGRPVVVEIQDIGYSGIDDFLFFFFFFFFFFFPSFFSSFEDSKRQAVK